MNKKLDIGERETSSLVIEMLVKIVRSSVATMNGVGTFESHLTTEERSLNTLKKEE